MKNLLFACLACCFFLQSCATFKRCTDKFGNTVTDTITVQKTVSVTVPKDSAILRVVTDTTRIVEVSKQGRATVYLERTPQLTTVRAICDTLTITKTIAVKMPQTTTIMGVSPFYRKAFWVLLVLFLALCGAIYLSRLFTVQIIRKNGANSQP